MHAGFLGAVDALWAQLTKAIQDPECGQRPLWFTGHSLGGAMAVLAAVRLINEKPQAELGGIYTFGQPMVGNIKFAHTLEQRVRGYLAKLWDSMRRDSLGIAGDHPMREYLRLIERCFAKSVEAWPVPEATR